MEKGDIDMSNLKKPETLCFANMVEILDCAVKNGVITQNPEDRNEVAVYREAGSNIPAGWYWVNIFDAASELFEDKEGQDYFFEVFEKKSIEPTLTEWTQCFRYI